MIAPVLLVRKMLGMPVVIEMAPLAQAGQVFPLVIC